MERSRRLRGERGATLVEFAFVAPVLLMMVFGIIDFGWIFAQHQDVRHGAREGARLAAVNWGTTTGDAQTDELRQEVCDRTSSLDNPDTTITIELPAGNNTGDMVKVKVDFPARSVSGFFSALFDFDLSSTVDMRLEQDATYHDTATAGPYTCS